MPPGPCCPTGCSLKTAVIHCLQLLCSNGHLVPSSIRQYPMSLRSGGDYVLKQEAAGQAVGGTAACFSRYGSNCGRLRERVTGHPFRRPLKGGGCTCKEGTEAEPLGRGLRAGAQRWKHGSRQLPPRHLRCALKAEVTSHCRDPGWASAPLQHPRSRGAPPRSECRARGARGPPGHPPPITTSGGLFWNLKVSPHRHPAPVVIFSPLRILRPPPRRPAFLSPWGLPAQPSHSTGIF